MVEIQVLRTYCRTVHELLNEWFTYVCGETVADTPGYLHMVDIRKQRNIVYRQEHLFPLRACTYIVGTNYLELVWLIFGVVILISEPNGGDAINISPGLKKASGL